MDKFTSTAPARINSDSLFAKFLKDNKRKIPEDVIVERVTNPEDPEFLNSADGILVHAYTLSLGLYLPFHPLIREILSRLGVAPIQLVPNCWRVLFSILALNFMCKINLGWKEFCYCYVVKQTSGGFYYFCLRDKAYALVTNLPNSEKGWKDDLIFIKGNWEAPGDATPFYSVPRTATTTAQLTGENNGFKPKDCEVKLKDLKKVWSLKNKDWRYLLDPAKWEIEKLSQLLVESKGTASSVPAVTMEELTFGGVNSHENDDQEVEMRTNVSSSSSKKRKLIHSNQEEPIFPSHSHDSYAPSPQSSTQLQHPITFKDQIDSFVKTINILHSSFSQNDYEELDWKSDEMCDPFEKDVELLEQKSDEEAGLEATQLVMKAGVHVMSFVIGLKKKNMMIKKLQATIEKQKKEIEELKLTVRRGEVEHSKCSTSTSASTAEEIEKLKKAMEETRNELKEMKLQQEENKASPGRVFERTLSFNSCDFFSRSLDHTSPYNDLFSRPLVRSPSYSDLFSCLAKDSEPPRPSPNSTHPPAATHPHQDLQSSLDACSPPTTQTHDPKQYF
ncbi:hypothetical protein FNV43_RR25570 [Rhamnella rubrinervis]|uniref:Uncharacterized protein n=1 Tax=Rhamnella rubrinervis TaxID=2594499 RepID=A0A8K0E082_9ROSA|nr:hypothetical protein FNV43_RR25570 [Rhamnella rubrinervis]